MWRIAVYASQVARRQTNEDAGHACKRALSLQTAVNLVDDQRSDGFAFERLQAVRTVVNRGVRICIRSRALGSECSKFTVSGRDQGSVLHIAGRTAV
jgi:hypothetical protein